jgi:hypothetical protein
MTAAPLDYGNLDKWVGIDGEGIGRAPHKYTYLCARTAAGETLTEARNWTRGLNTVECFDALLKLPKDRYLFAYSFLYDITKWVTNLPTESIYRLARPDLRRASWGCHPVRWKGYRINLEQTKFTLEDAEPWHPGRHVEFPNGDFRAETVRRAGRKIVIWDVFKFFQSKFVNSLKDWKVKVDLEAMGAMKDARGKFTAKQRKEIEGYCKDECKALGELSRRLLKAHNDAGIPLTKTFYGPGSTASVVLNRWNVKKIRGDAPAKMKLAITQAFFGGRFENSRAGLITEPSYQWDISSAYPYALTQLPCLQHGKWEFTKDREKAKRARCALVQYRLNRSPDCNPDHDAWGPFPYRMATGSICFPASSAGGWLWGVEYFAGEKLFRGVEFRGAWILRGQRCSCKPFAGIPELYRERIRIGKEGPGIVLKLAMNSVYGKLAQSVGDNPPFQSWIWAGLITATTRAMMLEMLGLHVDPRNLLMIATDGLATTELLTPPMPEDTGTNDLPKPLGGWEAKEGGSGLFLARPGIYFPSDPNITQVKEIKARGVGKSVLLDHRQAVIDAFARGEETATMPEVARFIGLVTGTHTRGQEPVEYVRSDNYGEWIARPANISFNPLPKRDGFIPGTNRLKLRTFGLRDGQSRPYSKALLSDEAKELIAASLIASEQPDAGDYATWE